MRFNLNTSVKSPLYNILNTRNLLLLGGSSFKLFVSFVMENAKFIIEHLTLLKHFKRAYYAVISYFLSKGPPCLACMRCDYYHVFMIPVSPILASGRTTGLIILYVNSSARLKTHNIIFLHILHMSRDKLR